ncbi:MAG: PAS domain-containing protein [Magnetococcales bacterium]|nr:PAS domain-containing protein [Magnetococcales bacterium]
MLVGAGGRQRLVLLIAVALGVGLLIGLAAIGLLHSMGKVPHPSLATHSTGAVLGVAVIAALMVVLLLSRWERLAEERLVTQRRYHDLLDHMSNGVAVYETLDEGESFSFKDFNRAGERIEGVKRSTLIGRSVAEMFPAVKSSGLFAVFQEVWRTGEPQHHPISFYDQQEKIGWRENYVYKLPTGEVVAVYEDSTKRKNAELALIELNQKLEQRVVQRTAELQSANEEMEAFTYSVSHDLRAPLRAIDGFSRILLEEYVESMDEQGRHYLERVRAGSVRMGGLIDDMLRLSRSTRGEICFEQVNLSKLAADWVERQRTREPERHVAVEIADHMWCRGDVRLMGVVLDNLMGNAWKYTSHTQNACIALQMSESIREGESVWAVGDAREPHQPGQRTFSIRDNGAGFDMAYAAELFTPFHRLHRCDEFEGNGIGLATVRRIVHRHGGTVSGEGVVGEGATFYLTLPV